MDDKDCLRKASPVDFCGAVSGPRRVEVPLVMEDGLPPWGRRAGQSLPCVCFFPVPFSSI